MGIAGILQIVAQGPFIKNGKQLAVPHPLSATKDLDLRNFPQWLAEENAKREAEKQLPNTILIDGAYITFSVLHEARQRAP